MRHDRLLLHCFSAESASTECGWVPYELKDGHKSLLTLTMCLPNKDSLESLAYLSGEAVRLERGWTGAKTRGLSWYAPLAHRSVSSPRAVASLPISCVNAAGSRRVGEG